MDRPLTAPEERKTARKQGPQFMASKCGVSIGLSQWSSCVCGCRRHALALQCCVHRPLTPTLRRCGVEDFERGADRWRARAKASAALRDEFADLLGPDGAAEASSGAAADTLAADARRGDDGAGLAPMGSNNAGAGDSVGKIKRKKGHSSGEGAASLKAAAAGAPAEQRPKGRKEAKGMGADAQRAGAGQGAVGLGHPAPNPGEALPKLKRRKRAEAAPGATAGGGSTDEVMALLGALPLRTPVLRGFIMVSSCLLGFWLLAMGYR